MPDRVAAIARILGAPLTGNETPAEIGAAAREAFICFRDEILGILDIGRYPADREMFPQAARDITSELFQTFNPRKMGENDALDIFPCKLNGPDGLPPLPTNFFPPP